jgi:hypothetical protein
VRALFPEFNPAVSLKALSFFGDVAHLPANIQRDLEIASSKVREIAEISKQDDSILPNLGSVARERSRQIEPELEI